MFYKVGGAWAEIKDCLPFHNALCITGKLFKNKLKKKFTWDPESNLFLNSNLFACLGPPIRISKFLRVLFQKIGICSLAGTSVSFSQGPLNRLLRWEHLGVSGFVSYYYSKCVLTITFSKRESVFSLSLFENNFFEFRLPIFLSIKAYFKNIFERS